MRKRPHVHHHGTPAELAEHAAGYSPNAESQFSRRVAHPSFGGASVGELQRMLRAARLASTFDHDRQARREAGARAKRIEIELSRVGALPPRRHPRSHYDV